MVRFDAAAIEDAAGVSYAPGSILVRFGGVPEPDGQAGLSDAEVLAVGSPSEVVGHEAAKHARFESRPDAVLIPGLVNAHSHLDLTHIGPTPHDPDRGFRGFVDLVRSRRHANPEAIAESVRAGIALSLAGGTVAIGDIAGAPRGWPTLVPLTALARSPLSGVSFAEFFAIGKGEADGRTRVSGVLEQYRGRGGSLATGRIRLGLQPHAPNTVALASYRWATQAAGGLGLPLSTHLAETDQESDFVSRATGPMRTFLEGLGLWDDRMLEEIGRGLHPVAHLAPILESAPYLVAHVNDATDEAIAILARTGTRVVYCPRASSYFGAESLFGPHRYLDMIRAGITVCLGTDSIVNLPPESAGSRGISILDEIVYLRKRDRTPGRTLLAMATTLGAAGLGLNPERFTFAAGHRIAGLVAVKAGLARPGNSSLEQALEAGGTAELLFIGK